MALELAGRGGTGAGACGWARLAGALFRSPRTARRAWNVPASLSSQQSSPPLTGCGRSASGWHSKGDSARSRGRGTACGRFRSRPAPRSVAASTWRSLSVRGLTPSLRAAAASPGSTTFSPRAVHRIACASWSGGGVLEQESVRARLHRTPQEARLVRIAFYMIWHVAYVHKKTSVDEQRLQSLPVRRVGHKTRGAFSSLSVSSPSRRQPKFSPPGSTRRGANRTMGLRASATVRRCPLL